MKKTVIAIWAFAALVVLLFACSAIESSIIEVQPRLENVSVEPPKGNWTDNFTYSVDCSYLENATIGLEIYDLHDYKWKDCGIEEYNKLNHTEPLRWHDVTVCSGDCAGTSEFRFMYDGIVILEHRGPEIISPPTFPIMFKNATVEPLVGEYDMLFNYSVEPVDVTKYINDVNEIKLEVLNLNPHNLTWMTFNQTNSTNNTLIWRVRPFKGDPKCKGNAEYYFKYDGKRWPEMVPYYGPIIYVTAPTPSPTTSPIYRSSGGGGGGGHVSKSRLKKMVKEILEEEQLEEWKRQIGRSDIPLSKPNITCNVTPEVGRWFKPFKYNATIKHPDRANMSLGLFVYKPGSDTWGLVKYKPYRSNVLILKNTTKFYNDENITYIEWESIGIFDEEDVNKNSSDYQYFIWYYDGYNEDEVFFIGPENVTENHEPSVNGSVTPKIGTFIDSFEYEAYINDPDGDDVIYISLYAEDPSNEDPSNKKVLIGEKTVRVKDGRGNATWVVPSDEYPKDIFTAENLGNKSFNSSFRFEYSDEGMEIMGRSKKTSDNITGPYVKPANVTFINASVRPETGKYSDKFTYKAEFYSSENNTIYATLRIYDPSNPSEWEPFDKNETGTGTIYITWSEVSPDVFGPDDFNKTGNYSIVWRDEILYTKEKAEGPWSEPRINEGIPMVWRGKPLTPLFFALIIA